MAPRSAVDASAVPFKLEGVDALSNTRRWLKNHTHYEGLRQSQTFISNAVARGRPRRRARVARTTPRARRRAASARATRDAARSAPAPWRRLARARARARRRDDDARCWTTRWRRRRRRRRDADARRRADARGRRRSRSRSRSSARSRARGRDARRSRRTCATARRGSRRRRRRSASIGTTVKPVTAVPREHPLFVDAFAKACLDVGERGGEHVGGDDGAIAEADERGERALLVERGGGVRDVADGERGTVVL